MGTLASVELEEELNGGRRRADDSRALLQTMELGEEHRRCAFSQHLGGLRLENSERSNSARRAGACSSSSHAPAGSFFAGPAHSHALLILRIPVLLWYTVVLYACAPWHAQAGRGVGPIELERDVHDVLHGQITNGAVTVRSWPCPCPVQT